MKHSLFFLGMAMSVIFGGGFLIRLLRDGDFYIAEFVVGIAGIVMLIMAKILKNSGNNRPSGI